MHSRILAISGLALVLNTPIQAQDWTQWRGPTRDGFVSETLLPESLEPDVLREEWSIPLQSSYSSPIVVGDTVILTETRNQENEAVSAWDWRKREKLWEVSWEGAMRVPFFARANGSWIRSTPLYADGVVYVGGMRDVLAAIDVENGETLWRKDFVEELDTSLPDFGFVSSPMLVDGGICVQAGGSFVKIDGKSGEILWRTLVDGGGTMGSAFSSPVRATIGGVDTLIVQTRAELTGVAPGDGTVLWKQPVEAFRGMNILTPAVVDDAIITSAYGGKTHRFTPASTDSGWGVDENWVNKLQGYMSQPTIIEDHAYLHLRNQRVACFSVSTGEIQWTSTERFGKYWSWVASEDRILALDQTGELILLRANPSELEILGRRQISEQETWAHLVSAYDRLFIRELEGLKVLTWQDPTLSGTPAP